MRVMKVKASSIIKSPFILMLVFLLQSTLVFADCRGEQSGDGIKQDYFYTNPLDYSKGIWYEGSRLGKSYLKSLYRAKVSRNGDSVKQVEVFFRSQGGDWETHQVYELRSDGSVRRLCQEHFTFLAYDIDNDKELPGGPFKVTAEKEYDREGKIIAETKKAVSIKTQQEIPVRYVQDSPVPAHRHLSEFGFYSSNQ